MFENLKRYNRYYDKVPNPTKCEMVEDHRGEWVKFSDHEEALRSASDNKELKKISEMCRERKKGIPTHNKCLGCKFHTEAWTCFFGHFPRDWDFRNFNRGKAGWDSKK